MSQLAIEGMKFYAYHGFYKSERRKGNHYEVDVYIQLDFKKAAKKDSIVGTINYVDVYTTVKQVMSKKCKLLETVAYQIGTSIQDQFPIAKKVKVRVSKLMPPLDTPTDQFYVEYKT